MLNILAKLSTITPIQLSNQAKNALTDVSFELNDFSYQTLCGELKEENIEENEIEPIFEYMSDVLALRQAVVDLAEAWKKGMKREHCNEDDVMPLLICLLPADLNLLAESMEKIAKVIDQLPNLGTFAETTNKLCLLHSCFEYKLKILNGEHPEEVLNAQEMLIKETFLAEDRSKEQLAIKEEQKAKTSVNTLKQACQECKNGLLVEMKKEISRSSFFKKICEGFTDEELLEVVDLNQTIAPKKTVDKFKKYRVVDGLQDALEYDDETPPLKKIARFGRSFAKLEPQLKEYASNPIKRFIQKVWQTLSCHPSVETMLARNVRKVLEIPKVSALSFLRIRKRPTDISTNLASPTIKSP